MRLAPVHLQVGDGEAEERLVQSVGEQRDQTELPHLPVAEAGPHVAPGGRRLLRRRRWRQRLEGQHHGVDEQDDGTDEEGRPVPPADGRGQRQQEWAEEVAHLGGDRARCQHRDQVVVPGEVDERHLTRREERVGRDTEQERARGQDPEAVPKAPAGHADRVAERAEGGLGPAAHPICRYRADPAGQATDGHEHEQDRELLVGQAEVEPERLERPGGEEREPLVEQADGDEGRHHRRCSPANRGRNDRRRRERWRRGQ